MLPLPALEQAQKDFVNYQGAGMSIIEMSHRGKHYDAVHQAALAAVREVLSVPEEYDVLLLQGGATMQFAMIPMNFIKAGTTAEYVHTGEWAKKAIGDGKKVGATRITWSGESEGFKRMPSPDEIKAGSDAAYVHLCGNETIGGIEYQDFPQLGDVPVVVDMSSHIGSRDIPWDRIDMVYAGAQKNMGPAGLGVVIAKKSFIASANADLPAYLSYQRHAAADSLYNTPPVFAIYMMKLTLDWVRENGGIDGMKALAAARSQAVYAAIDNSGGWYNCPVDRASRSKMNVVWRLPSEDLEKKFIAEATAAGFNGLKGHRSVGGCRASMYNAMPVEGAEKLAQFMADFQRANA